MTRFIKLPKSLTDDTSFDLLNLNGFGELWNIDYFTDGGSNNRLRAYYVGDSVNDESLTGIEINLDGSLTAGQQNTIIDNAWKAVKSACQSPGSIPVLEIPGDRVVSSIVLVQPQP